MAMNVNSKELIDVILEITAIKSKILLTENNIIKLSTKHEDVRQIAEMIINPNRGLRIYPDEFEGFILSVRKAIGSIEDDRDSTVIMVTGINSLLKRGHNVEGAQNAVHELVKNNKLYDVMMMSLLSIKYNTKVKTIIEVLKLFSEMQDRSSLFELFNPHKIVSNWDGIKSLNDLFETEIIPKDSTIYFDREFINYLANNTDEIDKIQWRNFERLVAEYFNRIGYDVSLGPGSHDGGIDIRVYNKERKENGPPLIIIQCKRYKEGNLVKVETVKAFYADVVHESATVGLIATTSRIEPAGKSTIQARGYNLSTAESHEISQMINGMWRSHFDKY